MVLSYNVYNEISLIHTKTNLRGVLCEPQKKTKKKKKKKKKTMEPNKLQERKFLL